MNKLSTPEWAELRALINVVKEGQETLFTIAEALQTIKAKKLYREKGTFAEFCEATFGFKQAYAYRLMQGLAVKKSLPAKVSTMVENPRQASALSDVPEADREKVLKQVAAKGKVTAKAIHEQVLTLPATARPPREEDEPEEPAQGTQKFDPRLFVRMESDLGATLRKLDALHVAKPNRVHHDKSIRLVKDCMAEVKEWQKAARGK